MSCNSETVTLHFPETTVRRYLKRAAYVGRRQLQGRRDGRTDGLGARQDWERRATIWRGVAPHRQTENCWCDKELSSKAGTQRHKRRKEGRRGNGSAKRGLTENAIIEADWTEWSRWHEA
jgi:hypothetical protein